MRLKYFIEIIDRERYDCGSSVDLLGSRGQSCWQRDCGSSVDLSGSRGQSTAQLDKIYYLDLRGPKSQWGFVFEVTEIFRVPLRSSTCSSTCIFICIPFTFVSLSSCIGWYMYLNICVECVYNDINMNININIIIISRECLYP